MINIFEFFFLLFVYQMNGEEMCNFFGLYVKTLLPKTSERFFIEYYRKMVGYVSNIALPRFSNDGKLSPERSPVAASPPSSVGGIGMYLWILTKLPTSRALWNWSNMHRNNGSKTR